MKVRFRLTMGRTTELLASKGYFVNAGARKQKDHEKRYTMKHQPNDLTNVLRRSVESTAKGGPSEVFNIGRSQR